MRRVSARPSQAIQHRIQSLLVARCWASTTAMFVAGAGVRSRGVRIAHHVKTVRWHAGPAVGFCPRLPQKLRKKPPCAAGWRGSGAFFRKSAPHVQGSQPSAVEIDMVPFFARGVGPWPPSTRTGLITKSWRCLQLVWLQQAGPRANARRRFGGWSADFVAFDGDRRHGAGDRARRHDAGRFASLRARWFVAAPIAARGEVTS